MSDLKFSPVVRSSALVRQGDVLGHARTLHTANRQALRHLGWPCEVTSDPKGRVLRQLRLQLGIDPSLLATNACISLSQLYELEDGGNSRFYSDSLRRQAGRRVARLLGTDWDQLPHEDNRKVSNSSNVVPLQRPTDQTTLCATNSACYRHGVTLLHPAPVASSENATGYFLDLTTSVDIAAIQTCSTEQTAETILMVPSKLRLSEVAHRPVKIANDWSIWWSLLMVIALGIAAGYTYSVCSSYRLYWPW
jgi:hypothetical protein